MQIIPAIDIKDGHCVRLKQGEMQSATIFSEDPAAMAQHWLELGAERARLTTRIEQIIAGGGTSLYDATAASYDAALARARRDTTRIHALVVMTDGRDESSQLTLAALQKHLAGEGDAMVKVFTIAYGDEADPRVLEQIAEAAKGSHARGSAETIVQVYQDMASFF